MRSLLRKILVFGVLTGFLYKNSIAQSCIPTNINGTTINLLCNQTCSTFVFQIPHIKGTDDYVINSIPYNPYPYTVAGSNEMPEVYVDDVFGFLQTMPFSFCFYSATYNQFVAGSNGLITFDPANASPPTCGNTYNITFPIPYISNNICSNSAPYYPKASIMGVFTDLYPVASACPPDRKIAWHIEGTAPCRKLVINYYHVGMFGNGSYNVPPLPNCNTSNPTTFQIVLYESTGIIDVNIERKICNGTAGDGNKAILGIQDWTRTKAVAAPGKNATIWGETNTAYRFTPSGAGSRFVSSELDDMSGNLVLPADTLTTIPGLLDLRFPNFCPPAGNNTYVVKTIFSACDNPANQLISLDTIQVNRTNSLNATATTTPASCGPPSGTITVTVPPGVGTPPYTYILDGGAPVTGPSPHTFNNVAAGPHTIVVTDASAGCSSTINVSVITSGVLSATTNVTSASCFGVNNGSITITSVTGTGPYVFSIDGGPQLSGTIPYTFSGLSSGNHTIVINDLGTSCTTGSMIINVPFGSGVTGTLIPTPTSCSSSSNGMITVTVLTGTAPFTYQLDGGPIVSGPNPYVFNNVSAGFHNVTIRDNLGCNITIGVTVTAGSSLTANITNTNTACSGISNGTITVNVLNGTAPYTYRLDVNPPVGGPNPYTFTNVSAGTHTITVTDNTSCTLTTTSIVAVGPGVTGTTSTTATSCSGVSNGTITVNATSGAAPFTYRLDANPPQSGANPYTFNNVAAGVHNITVTDNLGCTFTTTATVSIGAGITGNVSTTATACSGVSNGTITVNATSGVAPFTYQLDASPPQSGANPYTFNNVAAGVHNITVTDNLGCTFTTTATVSVGAGITGNVSTTATACSGVSNGTITVNATSGVAPFTYQLDASPPQSGANPYTFNNVAAGVHNITVTDNLGCTFTTTAIVSVGAGVTGNLTSTATSCQVSGDGTITANATSGSPPFTYQLDANPPQSGANPYTFNNVSAGSHTVVITDNLGCNIPLNITVAPGPPLNGITTSTPTSCSGAANGTITVTATSGTAPFQFGLDGGAPVAGTSPHTFNNVPAGPHTVMIADSWGCTSNPLNITVTAGPPLTTTVTETDVLCFGGSTGTITVVVPTIGIPPYQYSLDNVTWQASNVFNGLAAGTYTVYYRESNGCQGSQSITVNQPAAALSASSSMIPVVCNGQSNGTITVTATGGTSPYQYSLDGGAYQGSNIFSTAAGVHNVSIRDANGCTTPNSITVTEPAVLTAVANILDASCNGGNDGVITITPGGGNSGYQYSLDGINFKSVDSFHVAPGTYTVTIKDNLGCTATTTATVNLASNFTMTPQVDQTICEGTSTQLQLNSNATQYSWSPSTGLSNTTIANPIANPTVTTQYIVSATLARCTANDTVIVNVNAAPIPNAGPDGFICYGQTYQLQASGGTSFTWTPSTSLSSTSISNPITTPQQTITYTLSVIDANGCSSLITDDVKVDVTPPIKVTTTPRDTILYTGEQTQLIATSGGTMYNWLPSTGLSNPNIPNPIVTAGPMGDVVLYTVTASTIAGCQGVGYVKVQVYKGPDIYMPTAFTPNNDGKNDIFKPFTVGIEKINYFKVFNRWGQMIYSTSAINEGWNGKIGSADQPSGVYVWMVQGVTKDGKIITKKGTIALIR